MIVVVEGPSAAGKSTWTSRFDQHRVIPETGRVTVPPGLSPEALAEFWVQKNGARWTAAVDVERRHGVAICDTDPLKLHYDYCLARIGVVEWEPFTSGVSRCRTAIDRQELGIGDVVLVSLPDDATLERHRRSDGHRARRNFDVHRRLVPAIRDWYGALADLDPGRVVWSFPPALPEPVERARFDVDLFDAWMRALPGRPRP